MKEFSYYLSQNLVKKQSVDFALAESLVKDAQSRVHMVEKLPSELSKIGFENVYDALRNIFDAIFALEGYKSYSHEASIANLANHGFSDSILQQLDHFRYVLGQSITGRIFP